MKDFLLNALCVAAAVLAIAVPEGALAQTVTQQPTFLSPNVSTDLGNGPLELKLVQGNALLTTSQGAGTAVGAAAASTGITLTAVPSTPPCVGCQVSQAFGNGVASPVTIPAGTVVSAFNGTTLITMSTSVTVATGAQLAWGAACPSSVSGPVLPLQASVGGDFPFYTAARVCAYGSNTPGAQVLAFPIGAH